MIASDGPLAAATVEDVVRAIEALGPLYARYATAAREAGITGEALLTVEDGDEDGALQDCLTQMRVASSLHRRVLLRLFRGWRDSRSEARPAERAVADLVPDDAADLVPDDAPDDADRTVAIPAPPVSDAAAAKMRECADGTLWCLDAAGVQKQLRAARVPAAAMDGLDGVALLSLPPPVLKQRLVRFGTTERKVQEVFHFLDRAGAEYYRVALEGLRADGNGFSLAHLQWHRFVAAGSFGRAHLATHRFSHEEVCVKLVATSPAREPCSLAHPRARQRQPREQALAEVEQMMRVESRYCARVYRYALVGDVLCVEMPYYRGGTLTKLLGKLGRPPEPLLRRWFLEIAEGLADLHAQKICHRDLKCDNIFCTSAEPDYADVLLGDLGLAVRLENSGDTIREYAGTPATMAPEIAAAAGAPYGLNCDVWSLACVYFQIATGQLPAWQERSVDSLVATIPSQYAAGVADVLRYALVRDPKSRPSASEVVAFLRDRLPPQQLLRAQQLRALEEASSAVGTEIKGASVDSPTDDVIKEGPAFASSSEGKSWDPITLCVTTSALYFRPLSLDGSKAWTKVEFPCGEGDGVSRRVAAAEADPNDNDDWVLWCRWPPHPFRERLSVLDKRPPFGPPPPGELELLPDDARASRHSALFPFALTVESDRRRLFAAKSGADMWGWAMAIFHRGRPVPDGAKERATKEALVISSDTKGYLEDPHTIDQRLQNLLLWGADPLGVVIPAGKDYTNGLIYIAGMHANISTNFGFSLIQRPLDILIAIADQGLLRDFRGPTAATVLLADGYSPDTSIIPKRCDFLRVLLERMPAEQFDFVREGDPYRVGCNFLQLIFNKQGRKEVRVRSALPAQKELALKLVAVGSGKTANRRAAEECAKLIGDDDGCAAIDLNTEIFWRDSDEDARAKTCDPTTHRLAMTHLPMRELVTLRVTLTSIDLAHHSLISLPEEFFDLQALQTVNLKDNCLLVLPPSVSKLTSLRELDVSWNLLEELPVQLADLASTLQTLKLDYGDKISSPPMAVCWKASRVSGQSGTTNLQGIFDFLKARATSGTVENTQVKMLVLGRSEAGKTSLINALVAGSSQLTRVGDRTVGIDQHMLEMRLENGPGCTATILVGDRVELKTSDATESFQPGDEVYHQAREGGDAYRRAVITSPGGDESRYQVALVEGEAKAPLARLFAAPQRVDEGSLHEGSTAFYMRRSGNSTVYVSVTIGEVDGDSCELHQNIESVPYSLIAAPLSLMDATARVAGVGAIVRRDGNRFDDGFKLHEAREDGSFDVVSEELHEDVPLAQLAVPPRTVIEGVKLRLQVEEGGDECVPAIVVAVHDDTCECVPVGASIEAKVSELLAPAGTFDASAAVPEQPCLVKAGSTFVAASIAEVRDGGRFDVTEDRARQVSLDDLAVPAGSSLSEGDNVLVRMNEADNSEAARVVASSSSLRHEYENCGTCDPNKVSCSERTHFNPLTATIRGRHPQVRSTLVLSAFRRGPSLAGRRTKICARHSSLLSSPARLSRSLKASYLLSRQHSQQKALVLSGSSS